jgi:hypothetical protein
MTNAALNLGSRFAAALDGEDYDTAARLIAPDGEYVTSKGTLVGPGPIVASYREAGDWARANIDVIAYESSVRVDQEGLVVVTFVDHLEHAGLKHTYSCEQVLSIDPEGRIQRIVHREIVGEGEACDEFFRRIGVKR